MKGCLPCPLISPQDNACSIKHGANPVTFFKIEAFSACIGDNGAYRIPAGQLDKHISGNDIAGEIGYLSRQPVADTDFYVPVAGSDDDGICLDNGIRETSIKQF
jgi:hypothetical protein